MCSQIKKFTYVFTSLLFIIGGVFLTFRGIQISKYHILDTNKLSIFVQNHPHCFVNQNFSTIVIHDSMKPNKLLDCNDDRCNCSLDLLPSQYICYDILLDSGVIVPIEQCYPEIDESLISKNVSPLDDPFFVIVMFFLMVLFLLFIFVTIIQYGYKDISSLC